MDIHRSLIATWNGWGPFPITLIVFPIARLGKINSANCSRSSVWTFSLFLPSPTTTVQFIILVEFAKNPEGLITANFLPMVVKYLEYRIGYKSPQVDKYYLKIVPRILATRELPRLIPFFVGQGRTSGARTSNMTASQGSKLPLSNHGLIKAARREDICVPNGQSKPPH
jgi:hypothetical protein